MANILYLIHKKKFDLSLSNYLENFHRMYLMTSNPMIGFFLDTQQKKATKLFAIYPCKKHTDLNGYHKQALQDTEIYNKSQNDILIQTLERLCFSYLQFMDHFIEKHKIDLVITSEKSFLDVACITETAKKYNIPVCYLGAGFFRGESLTLSFERIYPDKPEIWAKRLLGAKHRPIIKSGTIPEIPFYPKKFKTPPTLLSLWQKLKYQRNPFWTKIHSDMKPSRSLIKEFKHRAKKKRAHKFISDNNTTICEPFILLPLQGNEICKQVYNPLCIRDMEHLTSIVANAVARLNRTVENPFLLVVKDHPNRPCVISRSFKKQLSNILYLSHCPIEPLLEKTKLIVTFNSLSGFEALFKCKPVVTLGPVFYAQPDLVSPVLDLDMVADTMKQALDKKINKTAFDRFVNFLKQHYNIKCPDFSQKKPSTEGLHLIASRIAGILEFSRNNSANPGVWTSGIFEKNENSLLLP
ncbi:MAG: hypothetical protein JJV89_00220 [Desulfosarcina sp.]|nr:hypothetical protein [Desulfobacterales bacterium]